MEDKKLHEVIKLHKMFKAYRKQMRDIWESFNLIEYYMPKIHDQIKCNKIEPLTISSLLTSQSVQMSKEDTFGAISSIVIKGNYERTLLQANSTFEDYISNLVYSVYSFYPQKLLSSNSDFDYESKQKDKLLQIIIMSEDRSEIIDKVIEDKIRNIFYGNPIEIFTKDKCKLEFGDHFKMNLEKEIGYYSEFVATRNILVHNARRVDSKYLKEVKNSNFEIGDLRTLSVDYLRACIGILEGIAAVSSKLVVENIFKKDIQGVLRKTCITFENAIKRNHFDDLYIITNKK